MSETRSGVSVLSYYLPAAFVAAVQAGFAVAVSFLLDRGIHNLGPLAQAHGIRLPGLAQQYLNSAEAAILQASVVIIGLYSAAFSLVISTVYGRIQADIRDIVLKHEISRRFLQAMAFLAIYASLLLLAQGYGLSIGYSSAAFLFVALVFGVRSFVSVGIGIFRLFDPLELRSQIREDVLLAMQGATDAGYRSDDRSFQYWYHERAVKGLLALSHMLEASQEPIQIARLAAFTLDLCVAYSTLKRNIRSNSLWFGTQVQYVNWLTASYEQLSIALNTRTSIAASEQPDDAWFERKVVEIVIRALDRLKHASGHDAMRAFHATYASSMADMTRAMAIQETLKVANAVMPALFAIVLEGDHERIPLSIRLEITSVAATSFKAILVGLMQYIRDFDPEAIRDIVNRALNGQRQSGDFRLPKSAYEAVTHLRAEWAFERDVESRSITPTKYGQELILASILKELWAALVAAKDLFFERLFPTIEELTKIGEIEAAAVIAIESYEGSAKLEHCVDDIVALGARCKPARLIDPENWPKIDAEAIASEIDRLRQLSVVKLADGALQTFRPKFVADQPDLWGQAYHILAHETFNAMILGEKSYALVLAKRFVAIGFASIERIKSESTDPHAFGVWGGQIALDIFELCGYAIILSGLDRQDYWTPFRQALDARFLKDEKGSQTFAACLALASYLKGLVAITPRSMLRFYWGHEFKEKLEKLQLLTDRTFTFRRRQRASRHPNATVRTMLESTIIEDAPFELFTAVYVRRRFPGLPLFSEEARSLWQLHCKERHASRHRRQQLYRAGAVLDEVSIPWFGPGTGDENHGDDASD